jgi:hypothetical protein
VVLVVGGILLLGGGDDGGGEVTTSTTVDERDEELEQLQEDADDAFDELPSALADSCELADVEDNDEGVVADITCEPEDPDEGAEDVAITVFDDEDEVGDAFSDAGDDAGEDLDTSGDCESDRYAAHAWAANDEPDAVVGQVACFLDDDEESQIVWTVDDQSLIAVAHRADDSDALLYRWWAELVDRAPADESDDDFPNDIEETLLSHVPSDFRDACTRAELRPRETASVRCVPESGASVVYYNQYPTGAGATAQYQILLGDFDVARNSGESDACPFEGTLSVGDDTQGRVFCAVNDEDLEVLVWSNRPLAIQAEATILQGTSVPDFWTWWTTAGPS